MWIRPASDDARPAIIRAFRQAHRLASSRDRSRRPKLEQRAVRRGSGGAAGARRNVLSRSSGRSRPRTATTHRTSRWRSRSRRKRNPRDLAAVASWPRCRRRRRRAHRHRRRRLHQHHADAGSAADDRHARAGRGRCVRPVARTRRARPVMVEFVSANPTGPLHVGHGRQAALGDAIANLLASQGACGDARVLLQRRRPADRESRDLGARAREGSCWASPPRFPRTAITASTFARSRSATWPRSATTCPTSTRSAGSPWPSLRREQDRDLSAFGVKFDHYYLESSLYTDGRVDATVQRLVASGKTYEQEGALWLRTTDYGDDKDRVMRKSDGAYTYFVPDVAYHVTKWERGFGKVINVQGGDHHSTVTRVRAGLQAIGDGHPEGLSRLRAAQDGDGDARRRGSEDQQARRRLRDAARPRSTRPAATRCASSSFRARPTPSSCSTSTSRARSPTTIPCTTSSMRMRACARCCGRRASRLPRRRCGCATPTSQRSTSPYEAGAAAPARRFSRGARQRGARSGAASDHVLSQGFGPGIPQLL